MLRSLVRYAALMIFMMLSVIKIDAFAADKVVYFHNDVSGSPVGTTDAIGNVLWKENYRPYGERVANSSAATANNKLWFTGKPQDAQTGLSYMGARYYDPMLGRFTGIDPKGVEANDLNGFNRYAYANNNPYKYVDPDGRSAVFVWRALIGGAAIGSAWLATQSPQQREQVVQALNNTTRRVSEAADRFRAWVLKDEASKSDDAKGKDPNVQDNRSRGIKAEDEVASDLENAGRDIDRQVQKDTPFGPRVIDIEVKDKDGNVLGGVEVKSGGSRYRAPQRAKDEWLRQNGYPVDVVRKP